jgi:hypothetical protein
MPVYDAPPYTAPFTPQVLTPGRPITLWDDEEVTVGTASSQFCLHRSEHFPSVFAAQIAFEADPGVSQIDLQTADEDAEDKYVTKTSITNADLNASFVGRIEAADVVAKFARLVMVSRANAVKCTAKVR